MRHIIPISGKDSLATDIWQTAHEPTLRYEHVFNDTWRELPETYEWLDRVEKTLGITIVRCGKSLDQVIEENKSLPSVRQRFCTKYSKIFPMRDFLNGDAATVYFGLRADEPDRVGAINYAKMTPRYPLREAGIGLATVYKIVELRGLLPPSFFWKRLFDEVFRLMGATLTTAVQEWPQWRIDRLFAWRSRPNCDYCFFKRRYEWVGLLWHYPDRFEHAVRLEKEIGNSPDVEREGAFFWIGEDYPLSKIKERAEEIFRSRVDAVCKIIDGTRQSDLFTDGLDEMDLAGTSCGLFCGK